MNIVLIGAFFITSLSFVALRPIASRFGLLDVPGGRKQHQLPTPLVGGLGIYLGTLCISLLSPIVLEQYALLLGISALILVVGVMDDARGLPISIRLSLHGLAAVLMAVGAGNQLVTLGGLTFGAPIELGLLAIPFTIFATVGVINAINMTDGIDGLSAGIVVIALIFLSIIALSANHSAMLDFSTILIFSLLAFLTLNFRLPWNKSAVIFLGDAGSTLLGFIIAWLVIGATQGPNAIIAPVYALWFLAVPLIDTVSLLIKRPLRGRSPFTAGAEHLHHRLLASGYSQQEVVYGMYAAAIAFGCIGLLGYYLGASDGLMFWGFVALFLVYMVVPDQQTVNKPDRENSSEIN